MFFSKLQDRYNVNTVPTVVRLTQKLKKEPLKGDYPFCPLCLGVRDQINNLLEVGSTIRKIDTNGVPISVQTEEEWFPTKFEQVVCFGCKRILIECPNKDKFLELLPEIVKVNSDKISQ